MRSRTPYRLAGFDAATSRSPETAAKPSGTPTPNEIAADVRLPGGLHPRWHARPYYGAIEHNVRAVYAHYMGPYDGNPVNLNPLTPEAAARKYVEYMGGPDAVLARAQ